MTIPGSLPPSAPVATRVNRAYGLPVKPPAAAPPAPAARPAEGPVPGRLEGPGDLRSVLNEEERAYFDQIAALGPITYGPGRKAGLTPAAPRGLRLDVQG